MQVEVDKIICGDCVDVMGGFPDSCIDLTVTSPPYDDLRTCYEHDLDFENIAKQLYRITKDGGVVVWVVGDSSKDGDESGTSFTQALYFKSIGFKLKDTMIYEKNGISYPSKDGYYQIFEYMFVLTKGKPKAVNILKDRKNIWGGALWGKRSRRGVKGELVVGDRIGGGDTGVRFNIWKYYTGRGFSTKDEIAFKHPAIFPDELAEDHILSWSNEGDLVLDPMCGSGTTCKMAIKNNRHSIGIDISEEYCDIANEQVGVELACAKRRFF